MLFFFCFFLFIYVFLLLLLLLLWKKTTDDKCLLCQNKQTQLHVLNNCTKAAEDGRYTWRHDSILYTLLHYIQQLTNFGFEIYADLQGFRPPTQLFNRFRPDIVLVKENEITAIELTCCFETNIIKSNEYKKMKYENLEKDCCFEALWNLSLTEAGKVWKVTKNNLFNENRCQRKFYKESVRSFMESLEQNQRLVTFIESLSEKVLVSIVERRWRNFK